MLPGSRAPGRAGVYGLVSACSSIYHKSPVAPTMVLWRYPGRYSFMAFPAKGAYPPSWFAGATTSIVATGVARGRKHTEAGGQTLGLSCLSH